MAKSGNRIINKIGIRVLSFALSALTALYSFNFEPPKAKAAEVSAVTSVLDDVCKYVRGLQVKYPPEFGDEWMVLGLARSGRPAESFDSYYASVVSEVKSKNGMLSDSKYTEYARVTVALGALGKSPKSVGGYDLLSYLEDYENVLSQGINGPIWALIAFDSGEFTTKDALIRDKYIAYILSQEISGGGWALSGTVADPDITFMAIYGLSNYYKGKPKVKAAVDRALTVMSAKQEASTAGFTSWGTTNSESVVQGIVALASLGIDCQKDQRFIKNGRSMVDRLLDFKTPADGATAFKHVLTGGANGMATEQALYGLIAYERISTGKGFLFRYKETSSGGNTDSGGSDNGGSDNGGSGNGGSGDGNGGGALIIPNYTVTELKPLIEKTGAWLVSEYDPPGAKDMAGVWSPFAISRGEGVSSFAAPDGYYTGFASASEEALESEETFTAAEISKLIVALTSVDGKMGAKADICAFGQDNRDLSESIASFQEVVKDGPEGAAYALLALDSWDMPEAQAQSGATQATRDMLIGFICSSQLASGGWAKQQGPSKEAASIATFAALTALSNYSDRLIVSEAIKKGLSYASQAQASQGCFKEAGWNSAEATSWAIIALSALGVDCQTDPRFIKNSKNPFDGLSSLISDMGEGKYALRERVGANASRKATEIGMLAITAYVRLIEEKPTLFDMTGTRVVKVKASEGNGNGDGDGNGGGNGDGDGNGGEEGDAKEPEKVKAFVDKANLIPSADDIKSSNRAVAEAAVKAAEDAYASLCEEDKAYIDVLIAYNKIDLAKQAIKKLDNEQTATGISSSARAFIMKANGIKEATAETAPDIKEALEMYEKLEKSDKDAAEVKKAYEDLSKLKAKLDEGGAAALSSEAKAFIAKAKEIGEVTLQSENLVAEAEALYLKLSQKDKAVKEVTDAYSIFAKAKAELGLLKGDINSAQTALIKAVIGLGAIDLNSLPKIEAAEKLYNALSVSEKAHPAMVAALAALKSAKSSYEALKKAESSKTATSGSGQTNQGGSTGQSGASSEPSGSTDKKPATEPAKDHYELDEETKKVSALIKAQLDLSKASSDPSKAEANVLSQKSDLIKALREYNALSDVQKAFVEGYSDFEALMKTLGSALHSNEAIGVTADGIPDYVELAASVVNDEIRKDNIKALVGDYELLKLLDISFNDLLAGDGVKYRPISPVSITIANLSLGSFDGMAAAHINGDGRLTWLKSSSTTNQVSFQSQEFSPFAIAAYTGKGPLSLDEPDIEPENTKQPSSMSLYIALACFASGLILIAALAIGRRMALRLDLEAEDDESDFQNDESDIEESGEDEEIFRTALLLYAPLPSELYDEGQLEESADYPTLTAGHINSGETLHASPDSSLAGEGPMKRAKNNKKTRRKLSKASGESQKSPEKPQSFETASQKAAFEKEQAGAKAIITEGALNEV